jgi:hypothetical protein
LDLDEILKQAKLTLEKNWNGRFTIPSPTLYPHQWSWDSAFIAIGNSYYHVHRLAAEMAKAPLVLCPLFGRLEVKDN